MIDGNSDPHPIEDQPDTVRIDGDQELAFGSGCERPAPPNETTTDTETNESMATGVSG